MTKACTQHLLGGPREADLARYRRNDWEIAESNLQFTGRCRLRRDSLVVTGNAGEKGLTLGNPTATKSVNTATCLSGGGGSNGWVSTELTCERLAVPGVPHFDYLAPLARRKKMNSFMSM